MTGGNTAGLVIVQKDEGDLIWWNVLYHIDLGFKHIVVVDNNSEEPATIRIIKQLAELPQITVLHDKSADFDQAALTNSGIELIVNNNEVDWIFCLDADEFLWVNSELDFLLGKLRASGKLYCSVQWMNAVPKRGNSATFLGDASYLLDNTFYKPIPERTWQHAGHFRKSFCLSHINMEVVVGNHYFRRQSNPGFFDSLIDVPYLVSADVALLYHFELRDGSKRLRSKLWNLSERQVDPSSPDDAAWWEKRDRMKELLRLHSEEVDRSDQATTLWGTNVPERAHVQTDRIARKIISISRETTDLRSRD